MLVVHIVVRKINYSITEHNTFRANVRVSFNEIGLYWEYTQSEIDDSPQEICLLTLSRGKIVLRG
jgi:hypothetical protein